MFCNNLTLLILNGHDLYDQYEEFPPKQNQIQKLWGKEMQDPVFWETRD